MDYRKLWKIEHRAYRLTLRVFRTQKLYASATLYLESLSYPHLSPEWYAFQAGVRRARG